MVCCFTGHREKGFLWNGNENDYIFIEIKKTIKNQLIGLIEDGVNIFITGMADGADTYFAEAIIDLKKEFEHIKLFAVMPYKNHIVMFRGKHVDRYRNIIKNCNSVFYIEREYKKDCFLKRNDYMIDKSDVVMGLFNGKFKGGTFYTLNRAMDKGIKIIIIASEDGKVFICDKEK